jgi:hypothetical protein
MNTRASLEPAPTQDWSGKPGAEALAAAISRYWRQLGFHVVGGSFAFTVSEMPAVPAAGRGASCF